VGASGVKGRASAIASAELDLNPVIVHPAAWRSSMRGFA
jgi:hypothetical protein